MHSHHTVLQIEKPAQVKRYTAKTIVDFTTVLCTTVLQCDNAYKTYSNYNTIDQ